MTVGELEDQKWIHLGRGKVISKIDLAANPGDYPVYSSSASGEGIFGRYGDFMFEDERLTWSVDGGGRFFYREPHRYSVTNVCGWLKILDESKIDTKYLFYVLDNAWLSKTFDYTAKAHPSVIRKVYDLPIPSLDEQQRIVEILDNFDALVNDISIGLPAEIKARRQQYEYYRDQLLSFKELAA